MPAKRSPWFSALHEPPINGGPYSLYERQCSYGNLGSAVELVGKKALINSACSKCQWRGLLREASIDAARAAQGERG